MEKVLLQNACFYKDGRFSEGNLLIKDGKIEALGIGISADCEVVDLDGAYLVPGFLDVHTHGAAGVDVNAADVAGLEKIGKFFASQGTTGWLASVLTDTEEQTTWCLEQIRQASGRPTEGAQLLGAHLEGPFLASEYKGAMPEHLLQQGNIGLFRKYQAAAGGTVRYITVSPEVEGVPEMVETLSKEVRIAIGHSGADYASSMHCIRNGASSCTHTFNAMRLFHQHEPAIMGAVLESDIYCEAICDGRHLHPATVRMLLKAKGYDRVIAVTDSIMAAGLPDGDYKLGVNDIVVEDGDAKLADTGVRAGSTLTTGQALRNLVHFTGQPVERVLPLLTENPARMLGIFGRKGSLEPGKDADLAVLDKALQVKATYVGGRAVYVRDGRNV